MQPLVVGVLDHPGAARATRGQLAALLTIGLVVEGAAGSVEVSPQGGHWAPLYLI
jgi:hypothetical protein